MRVFVPEGLITGKPFTTAGSDGFKYVTVPAVIAPDPSREEAQPYAAHDFHLLVGDDTYYPVARPGLSSIDFTTSSIVAPYQVINVTVSFRVPGDVDEASFEFIPHWRADDGTTVNYCCAFESP